MEGELFRQKNKCCVRNCDSKFEKLHRFPINNLPIFNIWLQRIKPPNYQNMEVTEIYRRYYVCDKHFAVDSKVSGTRSGLIANAIPSLDIPGFAEEMRQDTVALEAMLEPRPSTSRVIPASPREIVIEEPEQQQLQQHQILDDQNIQEECAGNLGMKEKQPAQIKTRKSKIVVTTSKGIRRRTNILQEINVTRSVDLTPKAKTFYKKLLSWSRKIGTLQKKLSNCRTRLANCEKFCESPQFPQLLKYVNDPTYAFILSQVRNQLAKPSARRYTLDENILALTIFKSSGKAYWLLSKIFVLPSTKTLLQLLRNIPFTSGLNSHIFESLKRSASQITKEQEKLCVLMFDEISIDSGVYYHRGEDAIIELEDYGNEKHSLLADHANVFLLKGIYKQWKQPICFTFSSGPIKTPVLKTLIKSVIADCQKIGLHVIATVCDQGSANQSAINQLIKETNETFVRERKENPHFGFLVGDQEVVPLFDVPHIMKGIRNNLLNKDLYFSLDGEEKIAKWSHIEQFYFSDSSMPTLRMCSKLTDSHVIKEKINKMKVRNCTQVFSHTVGALMKRIVKWDTQDKYNLTSDAEDTADLILFSDKLFDSLNVTRISKPQAKPLKVAVF